MTKQNPADRPTFSGSVHQQSLENRPAVFSTREGKPPDDDSYMGYSIVVGQFQENEEYEGIAVGMPRGNGLRGKVKIFDVLLWGKKLNSFQF